MSTTDALPRPRSVLRGLQFPNAAQPDIVRSLQKDEYYRAHLHQQLHTAALFLLGSRRFPRYEREVAALSDLLYYTATTLLGQQTPGEEYCDLVQVTERQTPTTLSDRMKLVALQVLLPHVLERSLATALQNISPARYQENVDKWRNLAQFVFRFHLALFYIKGTYLELSKRFTGIHYIFTGQAGQQQSRPSYTVLGILIFIQQFISLYLYARNSIRQLSRARSTEEGGGEFEDEDEDIDDEADGSGTSTDHGNCPLCLGRRVRTTATECGHLFCWSCITSACAQTHEDRCPICRQPIAVQQLVRLYHYDAPQRQASN